MLRLTLVLIASSCVINQSASDSLQANSLTMPVEIRRLYEESQRVQADLMRKRMHDLLEEEAPDGREALRLSDRWEAMASERMAWHRKILDLIAPWEWELSLALEEITPGPGAQVAINRLAQASVATLRTWIEVDEPLLILERLESRSTGVAALLPRLTDKDARRQILRIVIDRQSGYPTFSDLDLLAHIVQWEAVFLGALPPGKAQLESLSEDLILLFSELDPDGSTRTSTEYYHSDRFTDQGMRIEFRDGSDQIRQFAWAFRVFATSSNPDKSEALLVYEETKASFARNEPINQVDLSLNQAVRGLVADLLGQDRGGVRVGPPVPTLQGRLARLDRDNSAIGFLDHIGWSAGQVQEPACVARKPATRRRW
ncbi:MAG: hypothetical protein ACYTG5_09715 [Planctomycetota bacterium]